MWYAKTGVLLFLKTLRNFMRDFLGYTNVVRHYDWNDFESNIVYNMLKNDNPVFIAAVCGFSKWTRLSNRWFYTTRARNTIPTRFASTFWGRFLYQNGKQNERLFIVILDGKVLMPMVIIILVCLTKMVRVKMQEKFMMIPNAGNNINYN